MSLKFKFKTKDEIPADHLSLYAERDGVWLLDVEGAVDKSKLDEFRSTNVSLLKARDELKQRFEGIDPDEVRKLMTYRALKPIACSAASNFPLKTARYGLCYFQYAAPTARYGL